MPDPSQWAARGITTLKHIIANGKLMSFQDIKRQYSLPRSFEFRYWQLRHAMRAQFPDRLTLEPDSVERLLTSGVMGKPLSTLYMYLTVAHDVKLTRAFDKWRVDIQAPGDDEWEDIVSTYIPTVIAAKDRFIQLKFLHRAYFTPHRMARIYPHIDPLCPRCRTGEGTFWHMVWACPKLGPYWEGVTGVLNDIWDLKLSLDPMLLLLSYMGDVEGDRYTKLSVTFLLFYARREIMLHWKSAEPPTVSSW